MQFVTSQNILTQWSIPYNIDQEKKRFVFNWLVTRVKNQFVILA